MKKNYKFYYDTLSIIICLVGIVLSRFLVNLGMFMLLARFLFIGSWKEKWQSIKKNGILLIIICSFYFLHIIGLLWTDNLAIGFEELVKKIALIIFPITILSISPIRKETIKYSFIAFVATIFIGTIWGLISFFSQPYPDTRNLIPSASHIRFSLNTTFSILIIAKLLVKDFKTLNNIVKILYIFIILWFISYLIISQSITGLSILSFFLLFYIPYFFLKHKSSIISYLLFALYLLIIICSSLWIAQEYKSFFTPNKVFSQPLIAKTPDGGDYISQKDVKLIENGNYIHWYCNYKEMKKEWQNRTGETIGNRLDILLRYINSYSPYKDGKRVRELSDKDIVNIKNSIANKVYVESFPLKVRLYKIFYQINSYKETGRVKGFSELQRLEVWRNSLSLIRDKWLLGEGTGDIFQSFDKRLYERKSDLESSIPHNQYLFVWACFGIFGLLFFIFWLFYPPIKQGLIKNYPYMIFLFIILLSMLTEDTLNNFLGRSFFLVFSCVMLFNSQTIKDFFK